MRREASSTISLLLGATLAAFVTTSCANGIFTPEDEAEPDAGARPDAGPQPDATPRADLRCDDGFINVEDPETGNCFMLFNDAGSWAEAIDGCEAVEGDAFLAVPSSSSENGTVTSVAGDRDVWLGASDAAAEDTWAWVNDEDNAFTNWRGGEPSNSNNREHCMVLEGDRGGSWDDRECDENREYVCERAGS